MSSYDPNFRNFEKFSRNRSRNTLTPEKHVLTESKSSNSIYLNYKKDKKSTPRTRDSS